ncbi:MAG: hypothetical protein IH616_08700 [Gemmatimonadales bacterium]|nr:hypothetical protein [Gemmatimonadales bacterium]
MKGLRPETQHILQLARACSGRDILFLPDKDMPLLVTLEIALIVGFALLPLGLVLQLFEPIARLMP